MPTNATPAAAGAPQEAPAYRTVVFDLDGTLLDTLEDLYLSVNHALAAHGLPTRSKEEVCLFTGNGIRRLIDRSVNEGRPEPVDAATHEAVFAEFCRHYGGHCEDHTAPYQGIPELISHLRAHGVRVAVVSNKADFAVQELVARQFPGAFDAVLGECEEKGIRKKPAPDMVEAALARMDERGSDTAPGNFPAPDSPTAPGLLAYVGDSEVDIATARAVGCACVSCSWGFRSREHLVQSGATLIVDTPCELERVLLTGSC